jgi:glycosyltransferase involved in cell wall biosynthesis/SAM-dependent methyltransferase
MADAPHSSDPQRHSQKLAEFVEEAPLERQPILDFVAAMAASLPEGSRVADVGAGSAPFRELFDHVDYVTVDRCESPHDDPSKFDILASAEAIPLGDESLDAILCTQVLEHIPNPGDVLAEFHRLLRPEGRLFLTTPLVWEEHEKPNDFFRYTRSGLEYLLGGAGFEQIEINSRSDCFTTMAQLLQNARWSLGTATDETSPAREMAFMRLTEIAEEIAELAPLDARHAFPLGYQAVATRPPQSNGSPAPTTGQMPGATPSSAGRIPILYLAPWVDLGGSDKGTIDWFKHIDREHWAPSIITTQPSDNRWLPELEPYAEEIWPLPDLMSGMDFPSFILGFIETRKVKLVHIMNSRLAFDLMPDMRCLADPPVVVVQLHAEEHDRSGYVRYVASRYGNLVDAFSVTSQQLARAMFDYDVPRSRIHVIATGVDATNEFNPDLVAPFPFAGDSGPRILWPGRLVAQKDPMLTLEVVKLLDERGLRFTLEVVGDGDMKGDVVRRAHELGVDRLIHWHPPSHEMPRWYRSSDLLLMTSTFEGVPYVMYEALAMGIPVVAPALPGNVELMSAGGGALIDPRDDVQAYADAIENLLCDESHRQAVGRVARERMLSEFSLPEMGDRHDALYKHLLHNRPRSSRQNVDIDLEREPRPTKPPTPISFPRDPPPERSVAAIVPCYQHGRFLPEAIQSLREQTLPPQRIVVVDDASADAETTDVLDGLEQDPLVTVIRMPTNSGPSVARNRALAQITESYVLPLDADDVLPRWALQEMVEQIERAPESVGFIYPKIQHFGNRHDFYEPPAYNLNVLLADNYCAATSLFDRRVFDAGLRYAEDIVFGHEDWDLVLKMAEHDIQGEAAEAATLWYRKRGFSRVNAAEYGPESFHKRVERRHPLLYRDRRERIKATWAPALSIILAGSHADPDKPWPQELERSLRAQSCSDFEVICAESILDDTSELCVCEVGGSGLQWLEAAVRAARGRFVLIAEPGSAETLSRSTFAEQLIRVFWSNYMLSHFVLAQAHDRRGPRLGLLTAEQAAGSAPCAVAWRRREEVYSQVELGVANTPVEDLILHWQTDGPIGWRAA